MSGYEYNTGIAFSRIANAKGDSIALQYHDGNVVSYIQLEEWSNRIAHFFLRKGLGKNDVVAIFNDKSPLAYASMIACLKCGIIYTNLDTTSPYSRIKKILERCKPSLILFDIILPEVASQVTSDINAELIEINSEFEQSILVFDAHAPHAMHRVTGADPAYIMFTSGSTGFPKGAVITHANILNFVEWGKAEFNVSSDDVFTNANPIYFDNSVFDFYVSLFSGAKLAPFTSNITKDPFTLVAAVEKAGCTSWFSVPSLLVYLLTTKAISSGKLPLMKRFIFGGEGFPKSKLKKLYELFGSQATLYNVYGPTECTCICSSYVITGQDFEDMNNLAPLGFLAPNFGYVLLGADDNDTSFGELGLTGPNVGAGYYNDAERTSKSFIQNPYNKDYNEIIYRTGDLVKVGDKGHLHFKGRADNQVKHMGYRIELEEIEAMLNTVKAVNEAAVIYEKLGDGLGQIVAFVSAPQTADEKGIMQELKQLLPDYMWPKKLFILDVLPKNQNGKIDRVALKEKRQVL